MVRSRIGKEIGSMTLRGKVDPVANIPNDVRYTTVAEQDLNIIVNCLSNTKHGRELANFCRDKRVLIRISLETDPYDPT